MQITHRLKNQAILEGKGVCDARSLAVPTCWFAEALVGAPKGKSEVWPVPFEIAETHEAVFLPVACQVRFVQLLGRLILPDEIRRRSSGPCGRLADSYR